MLTTVAAFREPWEAHMFCSRLEAEGVPAFVAHERHVGIAWHYSMALGGVKVQVDEVWKDEAESIQRRCGSGEFRSLLESEFGALDDIHCPNCGSRAHWKRRPILSAIIAIMGLGFLGIVLPPTSWVYFCNQCGTKFRQPLLQNALGKWAMIWTTIACEAVLLSGLVFGIWALGTQYRFEVVLIAALLAGPLIGRWLSKPGNDQE
jgi:DNA-directed RNA polymerase subunit RPC12/RpoP